jgi:seryl-tRNA synthetase
MLDLRLIRESPDDVRRALERRGPDYLPAIDALLELDERRRSLLQTVEQQKADRNRASEDVARLKRAGEDASSLIADLKSLSEAIRALDQDVRDVEADIDHHLLRLPNLPAPDVPVGDEQANVTLRSWGSAPTFAFEPKPHWELGEALGILDLARGARIAGSGFPVFTADGARLVRSLVSFMIDLHTSEHGYVEVAPPYLVTASSATGTGQLPTLAEDMYVTTDGLYLIPTAEVPVTNLHAGEMLGLDELPKGYVAYTPCFRREAGAHGKDTRGLIRVHQFDKVELVRFAAADTSADEHERLLRHAETVLQRLEIPYRVVVLATGSGSKSPIASWCSPRVTLGLRARRLMTSRCGRQGSAPGWRRRAPATSPTFRRAVPTFGTDRRRAANRRSFTRSTRRGWRCRGRSSRCSRTIRRPMAVFASRRHWCRTSAANI